MLMYIARNYKEDLKLLSLFKGKIEAQKKKVFMVDSGFYMKVIPNDPGIGRMIRTYITDLDSKDNGIEHLRQIYKVLVDFYESGEQNRIIDSVRPSFLPFDVDRIKKHFNPTKTLKKLIELVESPVLANRPERPERKRTSLKKGKKKVKGKVEVKAVNKEPKKKRRNYISPHRKRVAHLSRKLKIVYYLYSWYNIFQQIKAHQLYTETNTIVLQNEVEYSYLLGFELYYFSVVALKGKSQVGNLWPTDEDFIKQFKEWSLKSLSMISVYVKQKKLGLFSFNHTYVGAVSRPYPEIIYPESFGGHVFQVVHPIERPENFHEYCPHRLSKYYRKVFMRNMDNNRFWSVGGDIVEDPQHFTLKFKPETTNDQKVNIMLKIFNHISGG